MRINCHRAGHNRCSRLCVHVTDNQTRSRAPPLRGQNSLRPLTDYDAMSGVLVAAPSSGDRVENDEDVVVVTDLHVLTCANVESQSTGYALGTLVDGLHASDCGSQMAVFELMPSAGSTNDATMAAAVSAVKDSAEGTPFAVAG